jgi:hypothetical protein
MAISWAGARCEGKNNSELARPAGLEPTTFGFGGQHSIHLSYGRVASGDFSTAQAGGSLNQGFTGFSIPLYYAPF